MENRNGANIEAKVFQLREPKNNTLAMASLTIGGVFAVTGVKVMQGKNGPFVSMPQARDSKGEWHDICFPTSKEVREKVTSLVLEKYNEMTRQKPNQQRQAASPQRYNSHPSRGGDR